MILLLNGDQGNYCMIMCKVHAVCGAVRQRVWKARSTANLSVRLGSGRQGDGSHFPLSS